MQQARPISVEQTTSRSSIHPFFANLEKIFKRGDHIFLQLLDAVQVICSAIIPYSISKLPIINLFFYDLFILKLYLQRYCSCSIDSASLLYIVKKILGAHPNLYSDFVKMHKISSAQDWHTIANRIKTVIERPALDFPLNNSQQRRPSSRSHSNNATQNSISDRGAVLVSTTSYCILSLEKLIVFKSF